MCNTYALSFGVLVVLYTWPLSAKYFVYLKNCLVEAVRPPALTDANNYNIASMIMEREKNEGGL